MITQYHNHTLYALSDLAKHIQMNYIEVFFFFFFFTKFLHDTIYQNPIT